MYIKQKIQGDEDVRRKHDQARLKQKQHFDKKAQPKTIKEGNNILIKQKKTTTKSPFHPMPYKVLGVAGNRITAERDGIKKVRDKNQLKLLPKRPTNLMPSWERESSGIITNYNEFDIEGTKWKNHSVSAHYRARAV